jgi:insulin receptor
LLKQFLKRKKRNIKHKDEEHEMEPTQTKELLSEPRKSNDVILGEVIGQGNFGKVCIGYLNGDKTRKYAMKVCAYSLFEEAKMMEKFETHHVVKFITFVVTNDNKPCLVMEYLVNGDLKTYLQVNRPIETPANVNYTLCATKKIRPVWEMAIEIADGMAYLSDKGYIHNDLAARNCLLDHDLTVKIGGKLFLRAQLVRKLRHAKINI